MSYRFLLVVTCLLITQAAVAQNYRLAYFGETLTHYGARVGMEYSLSHSEQEKSRGVVQHDLLFSINLTVYRHPNNHIGVIVSPELGWRHTGRNGGIVQAAVSTGLFRSFYEAETYKPTENDSFDKVPLGGQWGFLPDVSLGIGKDFSVKGNAPIILFTNVHYSHQYPYNNSFLIRPALEAGIIFKTGQH